MRYLLDTNVISDVTRPTPATALTDWLGQQVDTDLFVCTLTLAEIRRGILEKAPGRKRRELEAWFSGSAGPQAMFHGRVLPFDDRAALVWAEIMARGTALGRPRSALDMVIAATAIANQCVIVTGNERHFVGIVDVVNPLHAGA